MPCTSVLSDGVRCTVRCACGNLRSRRREATIVVYSRDQGLLHRCDGGPSGRWPRRCSGLRILITGLLRFWFDDRIGAIAVLPVWRSPMMSWRWPRPIGVIASMAFRPVWTLARQPMTMHNVRCLGLENTTAPSVRSPRPSIGLPGGSRRGQRSFIADGHRRALRRYDALMAFLDTCEVAENNHADLAGVKG